MEKLTENWWSEQDPVKALDGYLAMRKSLYFQHNVRSVKKLIPVPADNVAKALDYGCGGGEITVHLAGLGYSVWACDSSPCSAAACREHLKREGKTANARVVEVSAPDYWAGLPDDFNLIVAKDVIEHIQDDTSFVEAAAGHMVKGGSIIIVTQNSHSWNYRLEASRQAAHNPDWCGWHPDEHVRFYNRKALTTLLMDSGLRPVSWRAVYLIPYREFRTGLSRRIRNLLHKAGLEKAFYWPDLIVGGLWPFNGSGWSIQVRAEKI